MTSTLNLGPAGTKWGSAQLSGDNGYQCSTALPAPRVARALSVLIVAGQPVVREGILRFLTGAERIRQLESASTGREAVDKARRSQADVALLSAWLEDMTLADAVQRISAVSPSTKIVVLAARPGSLLREEVGRLSLDGLLALESDAHQLRHAIYLVAAGHKIDSPDDQQIPHILRRAAEKVNGEPLTCREHEILRRAARGESNAEIAKAIYLAPTTVKSYLQNALRKLNARNRVEAVFKLSELQIL